MASDLRFYLGPVTGVEPATSSLRVNTPYFTRLHSSPLTCGNALSERYYDGLDTAATATGLHRTAPRRPRSCCCCGSPQRLARAASLP